MWVYKAFSSAYCCQTEWSRDNTPAPIREFQPRWLSFEFHSLFIHCLMMGDELLPKRSPDKNRRLVLINGIFAYRIQCQKQPWWTFTYSEIYIHCLMMGNELLPKRSPDENQRLVLINGIYSYQIHCQKQPWWTLTYSEIYIHCLMMGDELLPKRSPDENERLVLINGIYHVKYSARNSLAKLEIFYSQ